MVNVVDVTPAEHHGWAAPALHQPAAMVTPEVLALGSNIRPFLDFAGIRTGLIFVWVSIDSASSWSGSVLAQSHLSLHQTLTVFFWLVLFFVCPR